MGRGRMRWGSVVVAGGVAGLAGPSAAQGPVQSQQPQSQQPQSQQPQSQQPQSQQPQSYAPPMYAPQPYAPPTYVLPNGQPYAPPTYVPPGYVPQAGPYAPPRAWVPPPSPTVPPPLPGKKQSSARESLGLGLGVFGVSYATTAILGAITIDGHLGCTDRGDAPRDCGMYGTALLIPVAGPFVAIAGTSSELQIVGVVFSGVLQLVGVGFTIAGGVQLARQRRPRTADGLRIRGDAYFTGGGLRLRF